MTTRKYHSSDHTFVVCAYQESPFLHELLCSLEMQEERGLVLVSTSTPNEHIEKVCKEHDVDLVVNTGESSISKDWNYGYNAATTPLVTIAHQDDRYEPSYLSSVLRVFNTDDRIGVVHTGYYEMRDAKRVNRNGLLSVKRALCYRYRHTLLTGSAKAKVRSFKYGNYICCPSVTFDKSIVGPSVFDTTLLNNCDFQTWIDLASKDISFAYIDDRLMGHRIHMGSATSHNIETNLRSNEDRELLSQFWPKPLANIVAHMYSLGEKSNG